MSKFLRADGPKLLLTVFGFLIIADYFVTWGPINQFTKLMTEWAMVCASTAGAVAYINIVHRMSRTVIRRDPRTWIPSLLGLAVMVFALAFGLAYTFRGDEYQYFYNLIKKPLEIALTGLLIFFIASASYRTFRIRSKEVAVLLGSTIFIMLMNAPIGEALWSGFPAGGEWIMKVGNTAGQRALLVTGTAGVVVFSLRLLLGYELARKEEPEGEIA